MTSFVWSSAPSAELAARFTPQEADAALRATLSGLLDAQRVDEFVSKAVTDSSRVASNARLPVGDKYTAYAMCISLFADLAETAETGELVALAAAFAEAVVGDYEVLRAHVEGKAESAMSAAELKAATYPRMYLKLLNLLFNTVPPCARPRVLVTTLEFALRAEECEVVRGRLTQVGEWVKDDDWQMEEAETTRLLALVARAQNALGDEEAFQRDAFSYLQVLETTKDGKAVAAAADVAQLTVVRTVKRRDVERAAALIQLRAVQALEQHASHAPTYRLLEVFVNGSFKDYLAFYGSNQDYVDNTLALDHNEFLRTMRSLTVCSLAAKSDVLSYDDIKAQLGVDSDEAVERVVIDAVMDKVVTGKLDQSTRKFSVGSASLRSFPAEQWGVLHDRLQSWEASIRHVLMSLEDMRHPQGLDDEDDDLDDDSDDGETDDDDDDIE